MKRKMNVLPDVQQIQQLKPEEKTLMEAYIRYAETESNVSITMLTERLNLCVAVAKAEGETSSRLKNRLKQFWGNDPFAEQLALEDLILKTRAKNRYEAIIVAAVLQTRITIDENDDASDVPSHIWQTYEAATDSIIEGLQAEGVILPEGIRKWYFESTRHGPRRERLKECLEYYASDEKQFSERVEREKQPARA